MPAVGINATDENNVPLYSPIEINLPNMDGNLTANRTHSCGNLSGLLTVDYKLEIESPDTAWVIEISEGLGVIYIGRKRKRHPFETN